MVNPSPNFDKLLYLDVDNIYDYTDLTPKSDKFFAPSPQEDQNEAIIPDLTKEYSNNALTIFVESEDKAFLIDLDEIQDNVSDKKNLESIYNAVITEIETEIGKQLKPDDFQVEGRANNLIQATVFNSIVGKKFYIPDFNDVKFEVKQRLNLPKNNIAIPKLAKTFNYNADNLIDHNSHRLFPSVPVPDELEDSLYVKQDDNALTIFVTGKNDTGEALLIDLDYEKVDKNLLIDELNNLQERIGRDLKHADFIVEGRATNKEKIQILNTAINEVAKKRYIPFINWINNFLNQTQPK